MATALPSDVMSPELVLVDPELALRARAVLEPYPPRAPRTAAAQALAPIMTSAPAARVDPVTPAEPEAPAERDGAVRHGTPVVPDIAVALDARVGTGPPTTPGRINPTVLGVAVGLVLLGAGMLGSVPRGDVAHASQSTPSTLFFTRPAQAAPAAAAPVATASSNDAASSPSGKLAPPVGSPVIFLGSANSSSSNAAAADARALTTTRMPANSSGKTPVDPLTLLWKARAGVASYEVMLVRDGAAILRATSRTSHFVVPRVWTRAGLSFRIQPEDQLYVWPVVDGRRASRPIVDGELALNRTPVATFTG